MDKPPTLRTLSESADAWRARVADSFGSEALFDAEWRLLAVSNNLLAGTGRKPEDLVGNKLEDVPPFRPNKLRSLIPWGLGPLRVARIHADLGLRSFYALYDFDVWPLVTESDERLIHVVAVRTAIAKPQTRYVGSRTYHVELVLLDGTVVPFESEKALAR